ncbi:hypothetical protein GKQ23_13040 [Erwinia sp. E602]|uniref:hypothetical protein n=1 Tax=Erwinia sp. E602 TaxID=2675378 RepID=UPI001BA45FF5|nr:hypothetical protein [Erwinia sp. E602]QUG75862.1 hypothetical protein GKQ23_13040 [Erwinia sp. E602]
MDIQTGGFLRLEIGTAGSVVSTTWKAVPSINSFITSGSSAEVIDVDQFDSQWNRTLIGHKSTPPIDIVLNYIADNEQHKALDGYAVSNKPLQIRISYFDSSDMVTGFYIVYNGRISSDTVAGGRDEVLTKTYTFNVDAGPVATGVLTTK